MRGDRGRQQRRRRRRTVAFVGSTLVAGPLACMRSRARTDSCNNRRHAMCPGCLQPCGQKKELVRRLVQRYVVPARPPVTAHTTPTHARTRMPRTCEVDGGGAVGGVGGCGRPARRPAGPGVSHHGAAPDPCGGPQAAQRALGARGAASRASGPASSRLRRLLRLRLWLQLHGRQRLCGQRYLLACRCRCRPQPRGRGDCPSPGGGAKAGAEGGDRGAARSGAAAASVPGAAAVWQGPRPRVA